MSRLGKPVKKMILQHLPAFCWQTAFEVLTMLEGVDEDINEDCVSVRLCQLAKTGHIERRRIVMCTGRRGTILRTEYKGAVLAELGVSV